MHVGGKVCVYACCHLRGAGDPMTQVLWNSILFNWHTSCLLPNALLTGNKPRIYIRMLQIPCYAMRICTCEVVPPSVIVMPNWWPHWLGIMPSARAPPSPECRRNGLKRQKMVCVDVSLPGSCSSLSASPSNKSCIVPILFRDVACGYTYVRETRSESTCFL